MTERQKSRQREGDRQRVADTDRDEDADRNREREGIQRERHTRDGTMEQKATIAAEKDDMRPDRKGQPD